MVQSSSVNAVIRLNASSLRDYLIMAGFAVLFVSAAIGVGTLLASLSH
jgi:hypothetical protein